VQGSYHEAIILRKDGYRRIGVRLVRQAGIVANAVGRGHGIEPMNRNARRHDHYFGLVLRGGTLECDLGRSSRFYDGRATMTCQQVWNSQQKSYHEHDDQRTVPFHGMPASHRTPCVAICRATR